ncbi:MAG: hypothetical protein ABFD07_06905 [Methanobacterium sp.]
MSKYILEKNNADEIIIQHLMKIFRKNKIMVDDIDIEGINFYIYSSNPLSSEDKNKIINIINRFFNDEGEDGVNYNDRINFMQTKNINNDEDMNFKQDELTFRENFNYDSFLKEFDIFRKKIKESRPSIDSLDILRQVENMIKRNINESVTILKESIANLEEIKRNFHNIYKPQIIKILHRSEEDLKLLDRVDNSPEQKLNNFILEITRALNSNPMKPKMTVSQVTDLLNKILIKPKEEISPSGKYQFT